MQVRGERGHGVVSTMHYPMNPTHPTPPSRLDSSMDVSGTSAGEGIYGVAVHTPDNAAAAPGSSVVAAAADLCARGVSKGRACSLVVCGGDAGAGAEPEEDASPSAAALDPLLAEAAAYEAFFDSLAAGAAAGKARAWLQYVRLPAPDGPLVDMLSLAAKDPAPPRAAPASAAGVALDGARRCCVDTAEDAAAKVRACGAVCRVRRPDAAAAAAAAAAAVLLTVEVLAEGVGEEEDDEEGEGGDVWEVDASLMITVAPPAAVEASLAHDSGGAGDAVGGLLSDTFGGGSLSAVAVTDGSAGASSVAARAKEVRVARPPQRLRRSLRSRLRELQRRLDGATDGGGGAGGSGGGQYGSYTRLVAEHFDLRAANARLTAAAEELQRQLEAERRSRAVAARAAAAARRVPRPRLHASEEHLAVAAVPQPPQQAAAEAGVQAGAALESAATSPVRAFADEDSARVATAVAAAEKAVSDRAKKAEARICVLVCLVSPLQFLAHTHMHLTQTLRAEQLEASAKQAELRRDSSAAESKSQKAYIIDLERTMEQVRVYTSMQMSMHLLKNK